VNTDFIVGVPGLHLDGSWYKVGVEGSVDAFWVHRFLPDVVYEQTHSVVDVDPGFPFRLTPMSFALRVTNSP